MNVPPQVVRNRNSVYALVLAAGMSTRFGATKQAVNYAGIPLVRRAVATASAVCPERVLLVVGHDPETVVDAAGDFKGRVVRNSRYREGLGASIAAGVRSLESDAGAVIVCLADQPLVSAVHLLALIDAWDGGSDEIVTTAYAGTQGPPVLFGSGCFDALSELQGDTGAKTLFKDQRFTITSVAFEPAAIDVDKPEHVKRS